MPLMLIFPMLIMILAFAADGSARRLQGGPASFLGSTFDLQKVDLYSSSIEEFALGESAEWLHGQCQMCHALDSDDELCSITRTGNVFDYNLQEKCIAINKTGTAETNTFYSEDREAWSSKFVVETNMEASYL